MKSIAFVPLLVSLTCFSQEFRKEYDLDGDNLPENLIIRSDKSGYFLEIQNNSKKISEFKILSAEAIYRPEEKIDFIISILKVPSERPRILVTCGHPSFIGKGMLLAIRVNENLTLQREHFFYDEESFDLLISWQSLFEIDTSKVQISIISGTSSFEDSESNIVEIYSVSVYSWIPRFKRFALTRKQLLTDRSGELISTDDSQEKLRSAFFKLKSQE